MHFWIDKRSQACGFNGRHRVTGSLSAGQRRRRRRSKPVVIPVHRNQSTEGSSAPRQHAAGTQARTQQHQSTFSTPISGGTTNGSILSMSDITLDNRYFGTPAEEPTEPPLQGSLRVECVRYGVWGSFVLATISLSAVKYYLGHEDSGIEMLLICVLLVVATVLICFLHLFKSSQNRDFINAHSQTTRSGPSETPPPPVTQQTEETQPVPTLSVGQTTVELTSSLSSVTEAPPPPYHIAIYLPSKDDSADESPPPSYEKATT